MSYEIHLSEDGKYIVATHRGELTHESVINGTLEAHALGRKLGITRHLMDVTEARNVDSVTTTYEFAHKEVRETPGIDKTVRVAVLVSPDDHTHDFSETVTRNAGQDVTIFRDRDAAIRHLLSDM
jgi:hypothetical protein